MIPDSLLDDHPGWRLGNGKGGKIWLSSPSGKAYRYYCITEALSSLREVPKGADSEPPRYHASGELTIMTGEDKCEDTA
jgi:hypothetical protein